MKKKINQRTFEFDITCKKGYHKKYKVKNLSTISIYKKYQCKFCGVSLNKIFETPIPPGLEEYE